MVRKCFFLSSNWDEWTRNLPVQGLRVNGVLLYGDRLKGDVVFVDEIPKSASGKILRRLLSNLPSDHFNGVHIKLYEPLSRRLGSSRLWANLSSERRMSRLRPWWWRKVYNWITKMSATLEFMIWQSWLKMAKRCPLDLRVQHLLYRTECLIFSSNVIYAFIEQLCLVKTIERSRRWDMEFNTGFLMINWILGKGSVKCVCSTCFQSSRFIWFIMLLWIVLKFDKRNTTNKTP